MRDGILSLLAFAASAVFFGFAVFESSLGDVALIPAGLFSMAVGFVLQKLGA